jgi:hypothetical protein
MVLVEVEKEVAAADVVAVDRSRIVVVSPNFLEKWLWWRLPLAALERLADFLGLEEAENQFQLRLLACLEKNQMDPMPEIVAGLYARRKRLVSQLAREMIERALTLLSTF